MRLLLVEDGIITGPLQSSELSVDVMTEKAQLEVNRDENTISHDWWKIDAAVRL